MPLAAPAERSACTEAPGMKASIAASKRSFPRDCENKCTAGVQPPDRPTQSQVSVRGVPTAPDAPTGATIRPVTRFRPLRSDDGVPGQDLAAGRTQGRGLRRAVALLAQIDDRHVEARCPEIRRSRVGGSARCGDHRTPSRRHAVAIDEHAQALGQHDAGTIVVGEDERALVRARRQHDLGGAHLPQTLARQVGVRLRQMVGHPLHQADVVVIVVAEGRRARQQGDVVARAESGKRVGEPRPGRFAVDAGGRLVQQSAAHLGLLVGKNDPLAAFRRRQRRSETGRAGADDQHIAVRVRVLIAVGIGRGGRLARGPPRHESTARRACPRRTAAT